MTILEFLKLPAKDIRQHCIEHGIHSHNDFNKFRLNHASLQDFCDKMNLEQCDEITDIYCDNRGSYCQVNFSFNFDFQIHVDRTLPIGPGDNIIFYIYGTTEKNFRVTEPIISDYIHIWLEKDRFFDDRDDEYNNFVFTVNTDNKDTLSDTIDYLRQTTNEIIPHIEFCLASRKDGSYIKAYNSFNCDKFIIGDTVIEGIHFPGMIYARYQIQKTYNYTMDILESLLFITYVIDRCIKWDCPPYILDIASIIKKCKDLYLIDKSDI